MTRSLAANQRIHQLRHNLRACFIDAVLFSLMTGMAETYFAAFALALGASDTTAGLLAVIPLVLGAIFQLWSTQGIRWLGSYRKWVSLFAGLQGVTLLVLTLLAESRLAGSMLLLFATVSFYWIAGYMTGPAWSA